MLDFSDYERTCLFSALLFAILYISPPGAKQGKKQDLFPFLCIVCWGRGILCVGGAGRVWGCLAGLGVRSGFGGAALCVLGAQVGFGGGWLWGCVAGALGLLVRFLFLFFIVFWVLLLGGVAWGWLVSNSVSGEGE